MALKAPLRAQQQVMRMLLAPILAGLYGVGVVVWQYLSMMPDMQHQRLV